MSTLKIPSPWDPGYAIPAYVKAEGLQSRAFVTKWTPRGTYDDPDAFDPSWDHSYAVPQYIKDEGYGQGAYVTEWAPRGSYVGQTQRRIKRNQKAMGEVDNSPASPAGRKMAAQILSTMRQLPAKHQKTHLRAVLQAIDPKLWHQVASHTQQYVNRGVAPSVALELGLARALSVTTQKVALGGVASGSKLMAVRAGTGAEVSKEVTESGMLIGALSAGACTSDGNYIWTKRADGNGFWAQRRVGQTCVVTTNIPPPAVRTGGGGVTVTPTATMMVGPFIIPVVRPGNKYVWGLDDYGKLTADQAAMVKSQITKKIDYPGRGNWIDLTTKQPLTVDTAPGAVTDIPFKDAAGSIRTVWPAQAPWGQGWLTFNGWLRKIGLEGTRGYDARYFGFDRGKYMPIATFEHPLAPEGGRGEDGTIYERYGLWARIQPVGPEIHAVSSEKIIPGKAPEPVKMFTNSYQLQFMIAPLPDKGTLGGAWDWIMGKVLKLVVGFYDAVQDVATTLSDALCAMAQTSGSVQAAAAAGGPYAAAGAAGTKLALAGKCPTPLPPDTGQEKKDWLLPVAIGGGVILAAMLIFHKKKKVKSP